MISVFANTDDEIKGIIFAVLGFSFFSLGDTVFKYLGPAYPVYVIAFFASLFAFITLLITAVCSGNIRNSLKTPHLKIHLLRGCMLLVQLLCVIYALGNMSMAKTYSLIFAAPFLTTVLSIPLLKEQVDFSQWLAIAIGFTGVLIILRPGFIPLEPATLAAMGGAFLFACANIAARFIGNNGNSVLTFGIYVEFVIVPVTGLLALTEFVMPSWEHLALLAMAGILGAAALVLIAYSFVLAPPAVAAPFQYVQMLWAILLGYLFFGDLPDLWVLAGALVIIASGIWLILQGRQPQVPDPGAH